MLGNFILDGGHKVTLAGGHHHGQVVDVVKRGIVGLHTLQLLVHRQAQATANLLQLGDFGVAGGQLAQREHVGVVPALLQRPHREDEAQIGVKRQQLFFLLQNQFDRLFLALFAVRAGKVALVYLANLSLRALQIGAVAHVQPRLVQRQRQVVAVMALKRSPHHRLCRHFALGRPAFGQILAHRINKKQRQRLDAAPEQVFLPLKVVHHGPLNDQRLHLVGQHAVGRGLAQRQRKTIGEQHFFAGHCLHHMPTQKRQPRLQAQVVFGPQAHASRFACGGLVAHAGGALFGAARHLMQAQHLRGIVPSAHGVHRDALDQPLAKRLQAVQRVNQVAVLIFFERGPKPNGQQRIELGQVLLHHFALKAVWLVNDQHGPNVGQCLHVAFGTAKQVGLHAALVDELAVPGKRLVGGHHHRQPQVGRMNETLHRFVGVIDDVDFLVVVLAGKKRRRGLQAFERALADGVAGHQHNELGQPVLLVQLVDGFNEGEGFARAGFHQHIHIQCRGEAGGHLHRPRGHAIGRTHPCNVGLERGMRLGLRKSGVGLHIGGRRKPHIGQHIGNGAHRLRLVFQAGVLELGLRHVQPRSRSLSSENPSVSATVCRPRMKLSSLIHGA